MTNSHRAIIQYFENATAEQLGFVTTTNPDRESRLKVWLTPGTLVERHPTHLETMHLRALALNDANDEEDDEVVPMQD